MATEIHQGRISLEALVFFEILIASMLPRMSSFVQLLRQVSVISALHPEWRQCYDLMKGKREEVTMRQEQVMCMHEPTSERDSTFGCRKPHISSNLLSFASLPCSQHCILQFREESTKRMFDPIEFSFGLLAGTRLNCIAVNAARSVDRPHLHIMSICPSPHFLVPNPATLRDHHHAPIFPSRLPCRFPG